MTESTISVGTVTLIAGAGANMDNLCFDKKFELAVELCPYSRGALI